LRGNDQNDNKIIGWGWGSLPNGAIQIQLEIDTDIMGRGNSLRVVTWRRRSSNSYVLFIKRDIIALWISLKNM
jgi:hypothetical protein